MKYLKIAVLFSLINAIFFGVFLVVLQQQNLKEQPIESLPAATETESIGLSPLPELPTSTSPTVPVKNPGPSVQQPPAQPSALPVSPPSVKAPAANRCIVTIKGQRYDVTDFRKQHPGGDIFVCNSDMTQAFFDQHDQKLLDSSKMAALKVR